MYYRSRKFEPVKILIIVMIGAVSIVFTDLFILNGARVMWWEQKNAKVENELPIDIVNLINQNDDYLRNGIELPDIVTAENALPSDALLKGNAGDSEFVNLSPLEIVIANIEPATGFEGRDLPTSDKPIVDSALDIEDVILNNNYPVDEVISKTDIIVKNNEHTGLNEESKEFTYTRPKVKGKIAIIIDDMGVSLTSKLVEIMPAPLTLSYLPYAKNLQARTVKARKRGHEIMLHLPMEPMSEYKDAGSHVLKVGQSKEEFLKNLEWSLSRFKGFVGVNNHMGSRMTQDKVSMDIVIKQLKKHNLFFVDSRTIGNSVAAQSAEDHGLDYAKRDIFIDHEITEKFVSGALKKLENKAIRSGYAIAIGHPHKVTIKVLKKWIPTLKDKGLEIVPISSLLYKVQENKELVYNSPN